MTIFTELVPVNNSIKGRADDHLEVSDFLASLKSHWWPLAAF